MRLDRVEQRAQAFQRVVLALHRHDDRVGRGQRVERQQRQRRRAVDEDEVVVVAQRLQRALEPLLAAFLVHQLDLDRGQVDVARQQVEVLGRVHDRSPTRASLRAALRWSRSRSSRLSTPLPMVALPCGSRSTSRTRLGVRASAAARLTAVVVLPTPPFWLATAMMRAVAARVSPAGRPAQENPAPTAGGGLCRATASRASRSVQRAAARPGTGARVVFL